jgi:hypothetical protein
MFTPLQEKNEKECLEGTRTEILSEIIDWVNSTGDDVSRVLWLSGTWRAWFVLFF